MKTKLEIIEETAAFYNLGNRSVELSDSGFENCAYIGRDNKRCAFSRCCLDSPEVLSFLKEHEGDTADEVLEAAGDKGLEILKEDYRGHEDDFWNELQVFHDRDYYWGEDGLNEIGEERKARLIGDWSGK